jgi:hypothetical protein
MFSIAVPYHMKHTCLKEAQGTMRIIPPHTPFAKGGIKVPLWKRGIQGDFQAKTGVYNLYRPGNMVIYLSFSGMCR